MLLKLRPIRRNIICFVFQRIGRIYFGRGVIVQYLYFGFVTFIVKSDFYIVLTVFSKREHLFEMFFVNLFNINTTPIRLIIITAYL